MTFVRTCDCGVCRTCYKREWARRKAQSNKRLPLGWASSHERNINAGATLERKFLWMRYRQLMLAMRNPPRSLDSQPAPTLQPQYKGK